ncbi:hypothetical protein [Brevibacterium linens]|uniref:hypothetical protein n=1 Tax=Brevibacterium linens TaxID=1703 RepID=UPI003F8B5F6B
MPTGTLERDSGLLWHPYGPLDAGAHFSVTGADGPYVELRDASGSAHRLLDGMSSWWYRNEFTARAPGWLRLS